MIDTGIAWHLIVALCFVWSVHRERYQHDLEVMEKRIRHYKGGDL